MNAANTLWQKICSVILAMNKETKQLSYSQLFKEFAFKQLDKKYGSRNVRRGAACQEFVKYQPELAAETIPAEGDRILVWEGAGALTRLAAAEVSVSGAETLSIRLCGSNATDTLAADIDACTHRLPAALCVGAREACSTIAREKVQDWVDAYAAAGLAGGHSIITTDALTQQLKVPASCKMVLEGYFQKSEYTPGSPALTLHISCITGQM